MKETSTSAECVKSEVSCAKMEERKMGDGGPRISDLEDEVESVLSPS